MSHKSFDFLNVCQYFVQRALSQRVILLNSKNSHLRVCLYELRNTPVDLLKIPLKSSTGIYVNTILNCWKYSKHFPADSNFSIVY